MKGWVARHDTAVFLGLTYGIAWPLWLASGVLGRAVIRAPDLPWLVAQIGVFAPAFAAMTVGSCVDPGGSRRVVRTLGLVYLPAVALGLGIATGGGDSMLAVGVGWSWALVVFGVWVLIWFGTGANRPVLWPGRPAGGVQVAGWTLGAVLAFAAAYLVAWAMTAGASPAADLGVAVVGAEAVPFRELTPVAVLFALAMNLSFGGSLGEEPGWRGGWLARLLQRRGPLGASLVISFWWALWHAPNDLAQGFGLSGVGALLARQVWTAPVAILFTWVTVRAGGNLVPAFALHTALNAVPDFGLVDPARYARATMVFLVLAMVAAVAVVVTDRRMIELAPEARGVQ
jgi:membrane protease YdiL (CAAX protease family)